MGQTWDKAFDACEGSLLYIKDLTEFNFLKQEILEPEAERSVLWLAGRKLMDGKHGLRICSLSVLACIYIQY